MPTTQTSKRNSNGKAPAKLKSINPRTGEVLAEIEPTPVGDVREIVSQARKVQPEWAAIPPEGRARFIKEVRHRFHERLDQIVEVVSVECGKSPRETLLFEAFGALNLLTYMEKVPAKALKPQKVGRVVGPILFGSNSRIEWRPYGVVGAITPWNYPITNCLLGFLGALLAGNTVVLKPSEVTPASGELMRDLFDPLPSGVLTVIQGGGDVGAALVDAPCDKISFIGSPPTGRKILEAASKHLTPTVMELGGQDAAIVCEDADLDVTTSGITWSSFFNAGQTCCSIERIFVDDRIADDFQERFLAKVRQVKPGKGEAEMGPLTFAGQLDVVQRHVNDAIEKGATVLAGGPDESPKNENGTLWFAPTVLTDVNDEMDVVKEESFGPVITITRVRDDDEAIRRANEEGVNLTASVWTGSRKRAEAIMGRLRAGAMESNDHGVLPGMAWAPWGGVGESGFGRLNGTLGIQEFAVPVHIAHNISPKLKKIYWYPYNSEQEAMLRGFAKVLAARTLSEKLTGVKEAAANFGRTIKTRL